MSDDLVKRLRSVGGVRHDGATRWYINPDGPEAADRIEKLEFVEKAYQQNQQTWSRNIARIEKLEAALRYIERHAGNPNIWYAKIARKALEGKDD